MITQIFTTKKLEAVTKEFISEKESKTNDFLGDWNAILFYVSGKKCWMLINKLTKYMLILQDVKKADLKRIDLIFKETIYSQLLFDGIIVEFSLIEKIIGEVKLCKTDNDRSSNGLLNHNIWIMEDWKEEFKNFDNMNFRDLNNRLNSVPVKSIGWKHPKEKMAEVLMSFS